MFIPSSIPAAQQTAMNRLEKGGWKFTGWTRNGSEDETDLGCAMYAKKTRPYSTQYAEVDPEGNVN